MNGLRRILDPPAARPVGARGPRGVLAWVVAIVALVAILYIGWDEDPGWTVLVSAAAAVALTLAAVLLWVARRPYALAGAAALVVLAGWGSVSAYDARDRAQRERDKWRGGLVVFERKGRPLTRAEAEAVPLGLTRAQLQARLGTRAGRGVQRITGEPDMRCVAYRKRPPESRLGPAYSFCFRDGHYAALRGL